MGAQRNSRGAIRARVTGAAIVALRMFMAFALTFGTVLWAQTRLADDALATPGDSSSASAQTGGGDGGPSSSAAASSDAGEPGGDQEGGGDDPGADADGGADAEGSGGDQANDLYIIDIGVFKNGTTANAYAYASRVADTRDAVCAAIEERGGRIDFDAAVEWNNETWEYESSKVSWSIAPGDEAIARITPSGVLEAAGTDDGTVTVSATVDGEYTEDGAPLQAIFLVELRGQSEARYVTSIAICDDAGNVIDPSYQFEEGTLATAMLELQATVTVFDPVSGESAEYQVTPASGLSRQTGGELSDIQWESGDTRLGTVSEEGIYRPAVEGMNLVYAYSNAGFNGQRVTASAAIDMPGEEHGDYHPQSTLTVKAYYEDYPDQEVASKTYDIDDLEALGTVTYTYTALRGSLGFFTTTGRGPLLIELLKDAGLNPEGIARLRFGTPDNYQAVVSWDMLVDSDRYYFPNIDVNSYAGAVQVPPIVAIESHRNVGTDTLPNYDMDDQRRFLLLFGSKDTGETTTSLQVYNIHTLYVELEGSPPVQPGHDVWTVKYVDSVTGGIISTRQSSDPDNLAPPEAPVHEGYTFKGWNTDVDDASKTVTRTAVYEKDGASGAGGAGGDDGKSDEPPGSEDPDKSRQSEDAGKSRQSEDAGKSHDSDDPGKSDGSKEDDGSPLPPNNADDPGNGDNGGTVDLVGARADSPDARRDDAVDDRSRPQDSAERAVTELAVNDVQVVTQGRWSMLQAMNRHPSNVADLMFTNPFAPYAGPAAAGVFAAGGLEAFIRFRWQKRVPKAPAARA